MKDDYVKYAFRLAITVIGFFIVKSYNTVSYQLNKLNEDMINVKISLVEMQKSIMTEDKVKELIELELLKHGK